MTVEGAVPPSAPDRWVDGPWPASRPCATPTWCSGPSTGSLRIEALSTTDGNRWSRPGHPTIYLAGDPGVALAELGRHWHERQGEMDVWTVRLALRDAVDLRDGGVRARLGLPDDVSWMLDTERCREVGTRLRSSALYDGMLVPSVAFLDDISRWNAVVFVERVRPALWSAVSVEARSIRLQPADGSPADDPHRPDRYEAGFVPQRG